MTKSFLFILFVIYVIHLNGSAAQVCIVKVSANNSEHVKCTNIQSLPLYSMDEHWTRIVVQNPPGFIFSVPGECPT